jgi:hypothetical protein
MYAAIIYPLLAVKQANVNVTLHTTVRGSHDMQLSIAVTAKLMFFFNPLVLLTEWLKLTTLVLTCYKTSIKHILVSILSYHNVYR